MVKKRPFSECSSESKAKRPCPKTKRIINEYGKVVTRRNLDLDGVVEPSASSIKEKRQRFCSSLGAIVNETTMAKILESVGEIYEDPDLAIHQTSIMRRNAKEAKKFLTKIRLPKPDGGEFIWHLCRLDSLMQYFSNKSKWFRDALIDVVQRCGHRLNLVCYTDELTPGDAFSPDLPRKAYVVYVSIFEFGPKLLTRMEAWMPVALIRSSTVKSIDGGLPCVFRYLFRSWACGEPLSVSTLGVIIELDRPTVFVFETVMNLQDLDAHRAQLSWKGVGSLKPCIKCRNCMKKGHHSVTDGSWQIDITETNTDKFDLTTDADMWEVVDMIAEAHGADRERLEKAHGLNHNANGIWQDRKLRDFCKPISGTRYDPMHVMYVGGVLSQAMWEFLNDCKRKMKIRYSHLENFVHADWKCSFHRKKMFAKVRNIFSKKREKSANRKVGVKMIASELLAAYPLVRRFAELHGNDELHDAKVCFLSACEVADALQQAKFQHFECRKTMAKLIKDLVRKYLDVRAAVYGKKGIKPKHHKLCHLWKQLEDDGFLMDCFILEHMHCMIKPLAEDLRHTRHYESTAIRRAVQARVHQLKKQEINRQLLGNKQLCPMLSAVLKHPTSVGLLLLRPGGQQLHTEDIIFLGEDLSSCFLIKACYMSAVPGLVLEELLLAEVQW